MTKQLKIALIAIATLFAFGAQAADDMSAPAAKPAAHAKKAMHAKKKVAHKKAAKKAAAEQSGAAAK